jgi:hypothetical protein
LQLKYDILVGHNKKIEKGYDELKGEMKGFTGDKVSPRNTDYQGMTCLQSFEMMMPPKQIKLILELTNKILHEKGKTELTHGGLFRYFGVCMLMALSKFRGNRRYLWGEGEGRASISKYLPQIDLDQQ